MQRVRIADNTLFLKAKGAEPRDSSPISFIAGDFLSLRPAIYAAGEGEVRIRNVRYTAL